VPGRKSQALVWECQSLWESFNFQLENASLLRKRTICGWQIGNLRCRSSKLPSRKIEFNAGSSNHLSGRRIKGDLAGSKSQLPVRECNLFWESINFRLEDKYWSETDSNFLLGGGCSQLKCSNFWAENWDLPYRSSKLSSRRTEFNAGRNYHLSKGRFNTTCLGDILTSWLENSIDLGKVWTSSWRIEIYASETGNFLLGRLSSTLVDTLISQLADSIPSDPSTKYSPLLCGVCHSSVQIINFRPETWYLPKSDWELSTPKIEFNDGRNYHLLARWLKTLCLGESPNFRIENSIFCEKFSTSGQTILGLTNFGPRILFAHGKYSLQVRRVAITSTQYLKNPWRNESSRFNGIDLNKRRTNSGEDPKKTRTRPERYLNAWLPDYTLYPNCCLADCPIYTIILPGNEWE